MPKAGEERGEDAKHFLDLPALHTRYRASEMPHVRNFGSSGSPQTAGGRGRASSFPQLRKQLGRCIQKAQEALGSWECWLGLERSPAGER